MDALAIKTETKNLIDALDYEQAVRVYGYALSVDRQRQKPGLQKLKNYAGKLNLDIDLDALRGRNDPR